MLLVRARSSTIAKVRCTVARIERRECSVAAVTKDEEAAPRYPPILDHSLEGRFRRNAEDVAEGVARARTVEEKMIKLNMPRYYGFRSTVFEESKICYNAVDQAQYLTRTHVPKEPGLPSYYDNVITPEKLKDKVDQLRGSIEECLSFEYSSRIRTAELDEATLEEPAAMDDITSKAVSKQIHRALASDLAADYPHLTDAEIDHDPRIEAFWFAGGVPPPTAVKIWRRRAALRRQHAVTKMPDNFEDYPVNREIQYIGSPNFQLRHKHPLPEIISLAESENSELDIPVFKYDPRVLGYSTARRHGTNIPGFWPGDTSEFGLISYHKCGHLKVRTFNDVADALTVQSVLGSWGWLLAQACNLGFSTLNEITYPLTNQMIITNGRWWTFSVYQLNTTIMHAFHHDENPRRNICWMSKPMKLFEGIENGQVVGLNDEVIEHLVKFYANEPRERVGLEMKPYLVGGDGVVANVIGNMKRAWLEERFKLLQSNRPRHRRLPEVYNWQDIYLRKMKTRPLDKKREPWEFGINMWHRRLDDHCPRYIPRAVRVLKQNPKWEKTYYP